MDPAQEINHCLFQVGKDQVLDLLVLVSSGITAFTPPAYQPCVLQGVLLLLQMGKLILRWA